MFAKLSFNFTKFASACANMIWKRCIITSGSSIFLYFFCRVWSQLAPWWRNWDINSGAWLAGLSFGFTLSNFTWSNLVVRRPSYLSIFMFLTEHLYLPLSIMMEFLLHLIFILPISMHSGKIFRFITISIFRRRCEKLLWLWGAYSFFWV